MQKRGADDWAPHTRETSPPPSPAWPARACGHGRGHGHGRHRGGGAPPRRRGPAGGAAGRAAARAAGRQRGARGVGRRHPQGGGGAQGPGWRRRRAATERGGATLNGIGRVRRARQRCGGPRRGIQRRALAVAAWPRRRRSYAPARSVPEWRGKRDGELAENARKHTAPSIWGGVRPKVELDGEAELQLGAAMADAAVGFDSGRGTAQSGSGRVGGGGGRGCAAWGAENRAGVARMADVDAGGGTELELGSV